MRRRVSVAEMVTLMVVEVLQHRGRGATVRYLVRWSRGENSWITGSELERYPSAHQAWQRERTAACAYRPGSADDLA